MVDLQAFRQSRRRLWYLVIIDKELIYNKLQNTPLGRRAEKKHVGIVDNELGDITD